MLEKVRNATNKSLSGKNREVFLTEIGVIFHGLLLEHFRKFPVSAAGGMMLAKCVVLAFRPFRYETYNYFRDIKSYQDTVNSFNISGLSERFEFIRQLGNVFLVPSDTLKSYITEGYLGRVEPVLLKPYLAMRGDWGQFDKSFVDGDYEGAGTESKGLRDRFGRLSVMMKELDGSKLSEGISVRNMPSMPMMTASLTGGFSLSSRPF